ncbi:trypsin-like serine peptidase [Pseudomonas putida]|uniref:trypsin-like serine peptidase n=1 Tax=Pseudomonas putida TaxID=303 RepID=UPI000648553D|nr:trypsin-like peptidase domain-containing protein [Pseudomonas putida]
MTIGTSPEVFPKVLARYAYWVSVMNAAQSTLPPDMEISRRQKYVEELAPDAINDFPVLWKALVADLIARDKLDVFIAALYQSSFADSVLAHILNGTVSVDSNGEVNSANLHTINNKVKPFFNAEVFSTWLKEKMPCVCAIWLEDVPDPGFHGTGFLVAPDLVLTARHVILKLVDSIPTGKVINGVSEVKDRQKDDSTPKLHCVFDYRTLISNFSMMPPPTECTIVGVDANWLVWSSITDGRDGVTHDFTQPPNILGYLDCAFIRLDTPIGYKADPRRGGMRRGWMQLNGRVPALITNEIITILQHPAGLPQNFAMKEYRAQEPCGTRIWYHTDADNGSSGSPCFGRNLELVAFHNAGRPTNFIGGTDQCNQGVRIDHVLSGLLQNVMNALPNAQPSDIKLWSLSTSRTAPQPVLGREDFKAMVLELMKPDATKRLIIVDDADDIKDIGKSGKSFSAELLKALARGRSALIVEFEAKELRQMSPDAFLREIGRRINLGELDTAPPKPSDERQWARWWAYDLPHWFADLLERRATDAMTASTVTVGQNERETAAATGQKVMLHELLWIVIDNVHRYPPEGAMKELLAGMMAITDTDQALAPGLRSLRWLTIGHVPDFVRERSIEYLRDTVSQDEIGKNAWIKCAQTAFESEGAGDRFVESLASTLYEIVELKNTAAVQNRATRIPTLSKAVADAISGLFKTAGIA